MDFLKSLGIKAENPGACFGLNEWSEQQKTRSFASINPTTGEPIGTIWAASEADYEKVMETAVAMKKEWASVPAPQRGEAVRLCTEALRTHKDALGSL
ncbi:MAG: aldehyde dehydrogenase family protein, partial [Xanthomonadales bacterium]|nr:aldehyde dehydrogenase family protein [Xanthomonadales bacterium]